MSEFLVIEMRMMEKVQNKYCFILKMTAPKQFQHILLHFIST